MVRLIPLTVIAILIAGTVSQSTCEEAFDMCIFSFEGASGIPTYAAGEPGVAISPPIIFKPAGLSALMTGPSPSGGVSADGGDVVGSVDATAEAYVIVDGALVLISDYECPTQSFSETFFKAANLGNSAAGLPISGASHETPQGDQSDCLDGLCVILTVRKYQSFTADGVLNIVSDNADLLTNCAVFRLSA